MVLLSVPAFIMFTLISLATCGSKPTEDLREAGGPRKSHASITLEGRFIASLVRAADRSGVTREWLVGLLDETPAAELPAPFTAPRHTLATRAATLEWLGMRGEDEATEGLQRAPFR
jgi:hypothetical protein